MLVTSPFARTAAALVVLFTATTARADPPSVVASIKPLHAIVAAVMAGVAQPRLLVKGSASPHDYVMRPSDAAALNDADLVVWIGASFELFLAKPLEALAGDARVVTMMERAAAGQDPHIWLDPANARDMAQRIAGSLSEIDPDNRGRYQANTVDFAARLDALDSELRAALAPVAGRPYLVFHDAYVAFEQRYGLAQVGAVTINLQRKPGARRIADLRETIRETGARCLFGEPQFSTALLDTLIEGSEARIGVLDPLGAGLAPGEEAYFTLMRNLAAGYIDCLD